VTVYLNDNHKILVRSQLNEFVETLPEHIFKQVHRSYLVNIDKIKAIEPAELIVNNTKVPVSPAFKAELMKTLGIE
jgi:DNA-binding LytR/AlgR family response regulator